MELSSLSSRFAVRRLCEADLDAAFALMRKNTVFYQYHPPLVTKESILSDMQALPPRKTLADKYYVGFWDAQTLVAVMDMILSYPEEDIAWIGFFMMDVRYQGQGIGSKLIQELCARLRASGYRAVRLGVDRGNPQSFAFWKKNHFHVIGEKGYLLMELA